MTKDLKSETVVTASILGLPNAYVVPKIQSERMLFTAREWNFKGSSKCIAAYNDVDVVQIEKDVKSILKNIHRVNPKDERAFGSLNLGEIFKKTMGFSKGMTFLSMIVGIATILAGVIGIGNILLISVKERTKEIGVRRALGATPREVRAQIILESVFLTMIAGIMGVILGAGF